MDDILKCQQSLNQVSEYCSSLEEELILKADELEHQNYHDAITGALNSDALYDLVRSSQNRTYFLLNMDNFSNINSAYGFEVGNEVLVKIIKMLGVIKPQEYEVYRFCADKFVLVGKIETQKVELMSIAESIISFFNASDIMIDDIPVQISFSIGISTIRGILAITQAELALEEIRKSRKNWYYLYDQKLENIEIQQESVYWINKIRESIVDEDIIVYYQPILNNKTGKIEKYECLSRIDDDGTLVSPYTFMEAAISTRVLHLMTQFVIETACKKFSNSEYEFSINITKDDLYMGYLEKFLLKNCAKRNIEPSQIVLEILEDISTLNEENILDQLESLRLNGFQIAIDDFGAENSNFSRLLEFHPDYLKIDGAFIKNIADDKSSRLITEAITYICKESGIKVIAEFIHNEEVQEIILALGIEYSQGYHIGAPSAELQH